MTTSVHHYSRWSEEDVAILEFEWASLDIHKLAEKLGRTVVSVERKAIELKLSARRRSTKSLSRLVRTSGYSDYLIRRAMDALGMKMVRPAVRCDSSRRGRSTIKAFTEEAEAKILAYLTSFPDGQKRYGTTGKKTLRGIWGIGEKPSACVGGCGQSERPHCARGRCKPCYDRFTRDKRRERKEDSAGVSGSVGGS